VPAALPGQQAAQPAEHADGRDVDRDQHVRHQRTLAGRDQPGDHRVADAHEPVGLIHGDAVRGVGEVQRVDRQPVVELAVVAVRRAQWHPGGQLRRVREILADEDEAADAAPGPQLPAGEREGGGDQQRDQPGDGGPVSPRDERAGTAARHPDPPGSGTGVGGVTRFLIAASNRPAFLHSHGPSLTGRRARPGYTAALSRLTGARSYLSGLRNR
jgi:hypothetical protein